MGALPVIAVTGANGAVGRALLARFAGAEPPAASVVAIVRRAAAQEDLPRGPRITPRVAPYYAPPPLTDALRGVDAVVHLAGILIESRTSKYEEANVESTRALVTAARAARVGHIVLVSALGADPRARNGYYRSKGEAERLVAGAGIDAAILRTPLLLGPGTSGGRAVRRIAAQDSARILGGGVQRVRPLDVDDLCDAILGCCARPEVGVRTHELVGPETLTYRELLGRMAERLGREVAVEATPIWLGRIFGSVLKMARVGGMTPDVIDVITANETVERNADGDLGVDLTPLDETLAKLCVGAPP